MTSIIKTIETTLAIAIVAFSFSVLAMSVLDGIITIINLVGSTDTIIGASMLFTPSFTVANLVRTDRRYSESNRGRNFAGLHTPAYRVFNSALKQLLQHRITRAFDVVDNRGYHKHIGYKSVLSVTISHGYSAVSIGARTIFAVDEWDRTIYHIASNGRLTVTPYTQDYDMTDVIAQVSDAIEVIKEHLKPSELATPSVAPTQWRLSKVIDDRPTLKPLVAQSSDVVVKFLHCSKNRTSWKVLWHEDGNPLNTRIESGMWHSAYKVEICGVVAWLPHSILGEIYDIYALLGRWTGSNTVSLRIPNWWLEKNIASKMVHPDLPF